MKKKIAGFVKKLTTWKTALSVSMWAILALVAAAGTITAFAQMPKRVEEIDKKVDTVKVEAAQQIALANIEIDNTKDNVNKLAGSIDKYVSVQAEQQKAQEMRETLMLKLIEQKKDR